MWHSWIRGVSPAGTARQKSASIPRPPSPVSAKVLIPRLRAARRASRTFLDRPLVEIRAEFNIRVIP